MHSDDVPSGFFEWLDRMRQRRESQSRLAAAREALNRVEASEFYVQCPCCVGRGTLTILLGAKDDEVET